MSEINYHGPVVAFDLDDTLFRERDFCRSGFNFLCNPEKYVVLAIPDYPSPQALLALSEEMDRELTGRRNPFVPFENFFKQLALKNGLEWNLQTHINAYRNHHPDSLKFSEGVEETLEKLREAGVRMALVTDGRSGTQRRKIEALKLSRYIAQEMILISEETGHEKLSSKEMFAEIVRFYPEASGFLYVGNNPKKDFYQPNLLGWTTLQVPYNSDDVNPPLEPESPVHAPGIYLDTFSSILNYI